MVLVLFLLVALTFETFSLYHRYIKYRGKEVALEKELVVQEEKKQDLKDYEEYTKSDEYVENTAKSKLGLINENEIIFREK